jgi:purine nucleoside phosphorylase
MPKGMYEAHAYCCQFGMQLARFETRAEANCFAETMQGNFVNFTHMSELIENGTVLQPVLTDIKYLMVVCVYLEQMRTTRTSLFGVQRKRQLM